MNRQFPRITQLLFLLILVTAMTDMPAYSMPGGDPDGERRVQMAALGGEPLLGGAPRGARPRVAVGDQRSRHLYYWAAFIVAGRRDR